MRGTRLSCLLLLLSLLTACHTQSPADQLRAELKTVASWAATARMTGESWAGGSVPNAYARRTLQAAEEALQESAGDLNASAPDGSTVPDLRPATLGKMQKLQQILTQMSAAVAQQDRTAMAEQINQLASVEREIAELKKGAGGNS
jgi:hypothetical protein